MISVAQAKKIIAETVPQGEAVLATLSESVGCVLAADLHATVDLPLFSNSAMDGFAVRTEDLESASEESPVSLPIQMAIQAGDHPTPLEVGQAAKIMTGAMIPQGAEAVVMREDAEENDGSVRFIRPISMGKNIRLRGEEIRKGETALRQGASLTPAAVGFLASLGIRSLPIHRKPRVALLSTGNELVEGGRKPSPGKIFESNSLALRAALSEVPCHVVPFPVCPDDPKALKKYLEVALKACDITIVSGGVSVGDYDYSKSVFSELGVETLFWQIAQKPGKPLFFGKGGGHLVFGVPGNPASALVCFYEYIRPALRLFTGFRESELLSDEGLLEERCSKKPGLTHFIRAFAHLGPSHLQVTPLEKQGSHVLQSFAEANCLAVLSEESGTLEKGSPVSIHWLPGAEGRVHVF